MKKIKRDFFFWLERLQITRKERIAISLLLILIVVITSITAFLQNRLNYNEEQYDLIRQEFDKRTAAIQQKREEALQKYEVQPVDSADSQKIMDQNPVIVNINTAGINELIQLKGIGETYAKRIIDYRLENGEFKSVDELLNVKGIGKKRLDDIKPFIEL